MRAVKQVEAGTNLRLEVDVINMAPYVQRVISAHFKISKSTFNYF
jgi:hypothetical protein